MFAFLLPSTGCPRLGQFRHLGGGPVCDMSKECFGVTNIIK